MNPGLLVANSFILTMLIGVPIAFVLGISSLAYLIFVGGMPLGVIGVRMFSGVNTFVLLALPFFILAGSLMNKTRITEDLVAFADLLVGRLPGSLAQVNILVSIMFAGLTGAAVADTAAIGSILIPAMKKQGYSAEYSAAVTTTSSIIGPIIPPSIIMVIYGSVTGMSIGALFLAGFIPGLLVGLSLMVMATYFAIKEKHPRRTEPFGWERAKHVTKRALIGLLLPIIIIGGILSGVFTPTEAAAMACFYALLVGTVILRTLRLKDIIDSLLESAVMASVILLVISAANLFGVVLTIERVPETVARFITGIAPNKYMFLLLVNIFLLFMGMIMETGANVVILAPILLPVALKFGVHPLHFALVMLVNVNIGLTTPPLGVCLFTAAPIAKVKYELISIKVIPFVAMEIIVLMLITYIPELILIVPRLAGMIS
jgi:tripartite ATP-independent transporter DctM subunit